MSKLPFLRSTLVKRIVKNAVYLFSASGFSAIASLLQGIFIARLLGVKDYGILGTIMLFTGVVNNIASFRMDELIVKYVGHFTEVGDAKSASAVFSLAATTEIISSFAAYGLVWLFAPLGAQVFTKDLTLTNWFIVYGAVVLFNLITESSTGLLQIFDRFQQLALLNAIQSFVALGLTVVVFAVYEWSWNIGIPLVKSYQPLMLVILVYMIAKLVRALSLAFYALSEAQNHWGGDWWKTPWTILQGRFRELGSFAISTNLSATINLVNKDSELLWVAYFRNPIEVGYYKLALALVNIVQMPVVPMQNATYPEFSREVARQNWRNVRHVLLQGSLIVGGYSFVAVVIMLILGQPFIALAYTPQYLPAYPALVILLIGFLIANILYWHRSLLLSLGLPQYLTKVNFAGAVLKIGGYLWLIPLYGYLGCAALLASFYVFSSGFSTLKAWKVLKKLESARI